MIGLYLGALAFGGILIGVSILLGGSDHDFDKDLDLSGDLDADGDFGDAAPGGFDKDLNLAGSGEAAVAAVWIPFLSMRFWTFGSAAFGMIGTVVSFVAPSTITLIVASTMGLIIGLAASYLFRQLNVQSVSASVGLKRFVGQEARVLLAIDQGNFGKIVIDASDGQLELVARTQDSQDIARGARVLITDVVDGTANVTNLPQLHDGQAGQRPTRNLS